jgi:hypothetical protein
MENLQRAYALDLEIRIADEKLPPQGIAVSVTEYDRDGVVYEKNGVKVIAFEVDQLRPLHLFTNQYYEFIFPSLGSGAGSCCN